MPTFARDFSPEDIHANPAYYREPINLLVRDANGDAEQIARIQSFLHKRICLALSCFVDKSDVHILDFYLNISQSIIAGITGHKIMFPAMSFSDAVEDAYLSDRRATRDALVGIDRSTDLASVHSFKSPFESLAIAVGLGWGEEFKNLLSSNGYELINLSPSLCETYFPDGNLFHLPWRSVKMFLNRARRTYVYILESPKSAACFPLLASECTIDMCWLNSLYMYIAYPLYTSAGKALAKSPIKALFVVDHLRKFKVAFSTSEWDPSEPHKCLQFSHCPHYLRFVTDSIGFYFSLRSVPHASDIYGDLSSNSTAITSWRFGGTICSRSEHAIMLPPVHKISHDAGQRFDNDDDDVEAEIDEDEEVELDEDEEVELDEDEGALEANTTAEDFYGPGTVVTVPDAPADVALN